MLEIEKMFAGEYSSSVRDQFEEGDSYLQNQDNHICPSCGNVMRITNGSGCFSCSRCGISDCGGD